MAVVMMGSGEKKPVFHDFLGMSCGEPPVGAPRAGNAGGGGGEGGDVCEKRREMEVEASASVGGSTGVLGLVSESSDLGLERQGVNNSEVFHFHGRKNATPGPEISTAFSGRKRSSCDSAYMGMINDHRLPGGSESLESSRLMKMLGKDVVTDRLGRSRDEETVFSMQPPPRPTTLMLYPPIGNRSDSLVYKWNRSVHTNPGQMVHYSSRFAQSAAYIEKPCPSHGYRDATMTGTTLISQAAADEGSRTSIKGSEVLNIANPSSAIGERNSSLVLPCSNRPTAPLAIEQEPTNAPSHHIMASASRQMTIFYAGQAHVFDDVHPNKADVIMALAGSNGGSWSTTYSPKPSVPVAAAETKAPSRQNEMRNNLALTIQGNRIRASGHVPLIPAIGNRPNLTGACVLQCGAANTRPAIPAAEPDAEDERCLMEAKTAS